MTRKQELISPNDRVISDVSRALTVPKQGTRISACPTNLDLSTMEGRALMIKATSPADVEIVGDKPIRFVAVAWCMLPETREDEETGEISEFVRTVFFDADGKTLRVSGAHQPLRLCAMLELFTADEWRAGIPLVVRARVSKRGRTWHDIQVDTESRYGI